MRTRTLVLIGVAVFAVIVGGFLYVALSGGGDTRRAGALTSRSYSVGKTVLYSAGAPLGYVQSSSCGTVGAPVVSGEKGMHLGPASYEPCELTVGLGLEKELYKWINDAITGAQTRKDLALSTLDANFKEIGRLELRNALLTQFSLPALDAANKSPAYLTLTIEPQSLQSAKPSGATVSSTLAAKQKTLIPGNFRFDLGGKGLTKVTKVDSWSFVVKSAGPDLGDLAITVSESDPRMSDLEKMLQNFVIAGENGPGAETSAGITFLDSTQTTEIASMSFTGVGMREGQLGPSLGSGESVARREFAFYVNSAQLTVN